MAKFDFKKLSIAGERTARYTFHDIAGEKPPVLLVLPATEANKPYFNEVLRRAKHGQGRGKSVTTSLLDEIRDSNRKIYAEHIVRGWENVVDADGKPVAFSAADALDFLSAIPDHLFDALREFTQTTENFTEAALDAERAAKN